MAVSSQLVSAEFLPSTTVDADVPGQWTIRVEVTGRSIACFGGLQVYVPPGWTMPQIDRPSAEGYVEVVTQTAAQVEVRLHTWRWITAQVEKGRLETGDVIEVRYA